MNQNDQQEFMQMQQQLQNIMVQKETLKTQQQEINKALDELEDTDDEDLYKSVGMLLISRDKDDLQDELNDELDSLDVKIQSLERKENQLKEKVQDAQNQLAEGLKGNDMSG